MIKSKTRKRKNPIENEIEDLIGKNVVIYLYHHDLATSAKAATIFFKGKLEYNSTSRSPFSIEIKQGNNFAHIYFDIRNIKEIENNIIKL